MSKLMFIEHLIFCHFIILRNNCIGGGIVKKKYCIILISCIVVISVILLCPLFHNILNDKNVVILAYHHFAKEADKNAYFNNNQFVIAVEEFEEQLKYLNNEGYKTMTSNELICYIKGECNFEDEKRVLVTIDDGNISSYYMALPLLEKYGYNSINFVIASRIKDKTDKIDVKKLQFLGKDLIKDIRENHPLMEIGVHSYNLHSKIDNKLPTSYYDYEELVSEVVKAKDLLDSDLYCYPFGDYKNDMDKAVKEAGYKMAFKYNPPGYVKPGDNLYQIPRVEVRGDYSIDDFSRILTNKKSIVGYWKDLIKKVIR